MAGVCRVIAGVSGSAGSLPALRYAAELARGHDAALIPVVAWLSPAGEIAYGSNPSPWLRQVWEDDAWQQLWDAFDAALGGIPSGVRVQPAVERGEAGRVLTAAASRADDLLVIGTGRRGAPRPPAARQGEPVTAWHARAARCLRYRRPRWSRKPGKACEDGESGTGR